MEALLIEAFLISIDEIQSVVTDEDLNYYVDILLIYYSAVNKNLTEEDIIKKIEMGQRDRSTVPFCCLKSGCHTRYFYQNKYFVKIMHNMCQLHNLSTYRWDEIFKDTMLTGAMVDRLAHKAHILDISIMNNTL